MAAQNGTIDGISLLGGNPEGITNKVSTTTYSRKAFFVSAHFPLYTTGDTATITGILTAIAAAQRNGRTLTLRYCAPYVAGTDGTTTSYFTNTANALITLSNTTTTGDAAGILADSAGTAITTDLGVMNGVAIVAIVDES